MIDARVLKAMDAENDYLASEVRGTLSDHGIMCFNVMGGPGAGKTSLIERTLAEMKGEFRFGVITGDVFSAFDGEKIDALGVPVVQINTETCAHLTANMIREVLDSFDLDSLDCLFIENIGNLMCPSGFDLGEDYRIAVLSMPEGDDKVEKYPKMFRVAGAVVLTKLDLAEYTDFNLSNAEAKLQVLSPDTLIFKTSAKTGEGLTDFTSWIRELITEVKKMGV